MATRAETAAATRARLIGVATELFLDGGYQSASLRDLARRAGVSTTAMYVHFRGKADLLAETLRARLRQFDAEPYLARVGADHDVALAQGEVARDYPARAALRRLMLEVAAAAGSERELREELHEYMTEAMASWTSTMSELPLRDGVDPRAAAFHLAAAEWGLAVFEALEVVLPSPDAWASVTTAAMRGLAAPVTPAAG